MPEVENEFCGLSVPTNRHTSIPTHHARQAGHKHERSTIMTKKLFIAILAVVCAVIISLPAAAKRPGFGELYYDGEVVRTVVPPAAMPFEGRDDLYLVPDQRAVAAVAPGDTDYHGGKWAVHLVEWNMYVEPYLLTSEAAIFEAEALGDITISRVAENDFKCPIQP